MGSPSDSCSAAGWTTSPPAVRATANRITPYAFGIDYLIGRPGQINHVVATPMLTVCVADSRNRFLECQACVVAVHGDNRRSWRAFERVGFGRICSGDLVSEDPTDSGHQVADVLEHPTS